MKINRSLLTIKGHFFLYWGFMASAPPFVMVVARQMGVPLGVQGVVSAVVTAAAVLLRPLIAAFADSFPSRRKIIFLVFIGFMIASYNPLGYLPPFQPPPHLSGSLLPPPLGQDTPPHLVVVHPHHHHHRHRHHHQQQHSHSQDSSGECVVTSAWDCFAFPYSSSEEEEVEQDSPLDTLDSEVRFSLKLVPKDHRKRHEEGEQHRHEEGDYTFRTRENRLEKGEHRHEKGENRLTRRENMFEDENKLGEAEKGPKPLDNKLEVGEIRHKEGEIVLAGRENELEEGENNLEGVNMPTGRENKLESENRPTQREKQVEEDKNKLEEDPNSGTGNHTATVWNNGLREQVRAVRRQWGLDSSEILVYEVEGSSEWRLTSAYNVSVKCLGGEMGTVGADGGVQEGSCGPVVVKEAAFWIYVLCLVVSYTSATTVESISDAICCDSIGEDGHYGRQRVWGVLSYGLFGALSGLLVDWRSGDCTVRDYRPAFMLMTACGAVDLLLSAACLKVPKLELQKKGVWANLRPLLRRVHFLVFLVTVLLTGFFDGLDTGFLFVLQEDIAEKSSSASTHVNTAQGLTLLVQAIAAIPFMFLGDWFVRKFSAERVISAVIFMYSIRLLSLSTASYFETLWGTVVVEVINGPCFGLGYTAIVVHAAALAPRGLSTTVQSVVGVCYGTLGYAGASFVGGVLYQLMGGQRLYMLTGLAALVTWLLHLAHLKLCPPNIKAAKAEAAESGRREEPEEVLQVMVGRDRDAREDARPEGGGTEGELLKEKDTGEKETAEAGKDEEKTIRKGNDEDTGEKGKEEKEAEESEIKKKESEEEVVDQCSPVKNRRASEKADEIKEKDTDEQTESDPLLVKNSVATAGEEREENGFRGGGVENEGGGGGAGGGGG